MKLGIDFGTSFSFVAEWRDEYNAPQSRVKENVPTIFYYDEVHGEKIGREAEQFMLRIPRNGVRNIKKYIIEKDLDHVFKLGEIKGVEGDYFIPGQAREFSLREIVAKFIKILIDDVLESRAYYYPGADVSGDMIDNIAVAIPVELNIEESWSFLQKCVAEAAGLPESKVYFIHEPVAAAMSYYVLNENNDSRILVYDLGGGTIDAAVVSRGIGAGSAYGVAFRDEDGGEGGYEVLAMYGERVGGNDFDKELADFILDRIGSPNERANLRINMGAQTAYGERFKKEVTEVKERLSQRDSVSFSYERMSGKVDIAIQRFEGLTRDLLEQTVLVTKKTLEVYKMRFGREAKLDAIVLSGGSSQMPMVTRRLEQLCEEVKRDFPGLKIYMERPDCAISFGAAIYAAKMDHITFVAPYTYGIYIPGRGNFDMINKNEPMVKHDDGKYILARKAYEFDTSAGRDLRARVYEYSLMTGVSVFKPSRDIFVPVYEIGGRLGKHDIEFELKLEQGKGVDVRVFDKSQGGKEIEIGAPPTLEQLKQSIEEVLVLSSDSGKAGQGEVQADDGAGIKREEAPAGWLRRLWVRLFGKRG